MQTTKRAKQVSRGSLTGEGTTVSEAKADLNAKIDVALDGDYQPRLVTYGTYTAVVYREPSGWCYRMTQEPTQPGIHRVDYGTHYGYLNTCLQYAAFHVIQNGCDVEKIRQDADIPEWLTNQEYRSSLLAWCRWQRAAKWAMTNMPELKSQDVHAWACDHSHEERFA